MWELEARDSGGGTLHWSGVLHATRRLEFGEVAAAWRANAAFRAFWAAQVAGVGGAGYCWECPPVTDATLSRPFECVFVQSPSLARMAPEPAAFAEHFGPGADVATFASLGGDAVLVAPAPGAEGGDYAHLAAFARSAPQELQEALWEAVGRALAARIGTRPVWLSTAGHGVGWLHVRLDSRPKYYRHLAYARA